MWLERMEQQKDTNLYSKVTIWLHGLSTLLILENVIGNMMILFLYFTAGITYDNPYSMILLFVYTPLCFGQLYSIKKMREGDLQGGKVALYIDSIVILVCTFDLITPGIGVSGELILSVMGLLVLNILVVFLLSATPARELRISEDSEETLTDLQGEY